MRVKYRGKANTPVHEKDKVNEVQSVEKGWFRIMTELDEAYIPSDDKSGSWYAFYLEDMDEPGDYALPASRFEVVEEE